ncbi:helix-turn-helix transcriptional regulator [bacterium]|nr:helix-turn-helix transcriptional regulator [bacterium]
MLEAMSKQNPFPAALKALRAKYGLSQFQLAIKLGKTPSKIAQYESGQRNPTRIGIAEIVEALKATNTEHNELLMAAGFMPENYGQLNGAAEAMELLKDPLFKDVVIRMRSSRNPAAIKRILETAKEILEEEAKEESEQSD